MLTVVLGQSSPSLQRYPTAQRLHWSDTMVQRRRGDSALLFGRPKSKWNTKSQTLSQRWSQLSCLYWHHRKVRTDSTNKDCAKRITQSSNTLILCQLSNSCSLLRVLWLFVLSFNCICFSAVLLERHSLVISISMLLDIHFIWIS